MSNEDIAKAITQSTRLYSIIFQEGDVQTYEEETLEQICSNNGCEYRYAMQDRLDEILDLQVGERLRMQFNRDSKDSMGWIKRISRKKRPQTIHEMKKEAGEHLLDEEYWKDPY